MHYRFLREEKMTDINKQIEDVINSSNVVLFMKGTPETLQCDFLW